MIGLGGGGGGGGGGGAYHLHKNGNDYWMKHLFWYEQMAN